VNSLDPNFFEANIPEAFSARKLAHAEQHQKMVEVLPFFYDVITKSNMISEGKSSLGPCPAKRQALSHHLCRQQARQGLLGLLEELRGGTCCC